MNSTSIYKIHKKGILLHGSSKTESGFDIASEPIVQILEQDESIEVLANSIKNILENNHPKQIPNPKNWAEFNKEFLKKAGLKSFKDLNNSSTKLVILTFEDGHLVFTPTIHAEKPDVGYLHREKAEAVIVPPAASNEEIAKAFKFAISKCN